jgi:hypothetical protein
MTRGTPANGPDDAIVRACRRIGPDEPRSEHVPHANEEIGPLTLGLLGRVIP